MNKKLISALVAAPILVAGTIASAQVVNNHPPLYSYFSFGDNLNSEENNKYWEKMDKVDEVISSADWDTLSDEQIDAKLTEAGLEPIGYTEGPLYKMTVEEVSNLSDKEWEIIDAQHAEMYGEENEHNSEYIAFDFASERQNMIDAVVKAFDKVESKLDVDTAEYMQTIINSLENIEDEETFFNALDKMYELGEKELDTYFEWEYETI